MASKLVFLCGLALSASPERYRVVELGDGHSQSPLRVHLYDLGAERGFRLAGIER